VREGLSETPDVKRLRFEGVWRGARPREGAEMRRKKPRKPALSGIGCELSVCVSADDSGVRWDKVAE
jgi:hypothetical protein